MSTLSINPMTELEAINSMLMSVGQAPVNTLSVPGITDVSFAKMYLSEANRRIQTHGWSFNTDPGFEIVPDENNHLLIPDNVLSLTSPASADYVQRETEGVRKIYNRRQHSFLFDPKDGPYTFDIVWLFGFDGLPQAAKSYITASAGQSFQANALGSALQYKFDEAAVREAYIAFKRTESKYHRRNLFQAPGRVNRNITQRGR